MIQIWTQNLNPISNLIKNLLNFLSFNQKKIEKLTNLIEKWSKMDEFYQKMIEHCCISTLSHNQNPILTSESKLLYIGHPNLVVPDP